MNRFQKRENYQDIDEKKGKFQRRSMVISICTQKNKIPRGGYDMINCINQLFR